MSISNLEVSVYQKAAPNDYALYLIAEFKPGNILFYKPVKIIFTLPQPQVPGTPVYLGLYNEAEGKLTLEEIKSFVSADGVTVEFLVTHFSTYAVLQALISQGAPIGASTKTPLPDLFTGSFSHSIPIAVPPGRKSMQPNLDFVYSSSNHNSWLGIGFDLNMGYIVRSTRLGPPTYNDTQDAFYLVTEFGATELVYLLDNIYQAKIESQFARFYKENDSWKVVEKDGSILLFGETSDSKETAPKGTFCWYVTKEMDTNGNFTEYAYTKDQGKPYLARIGYTGSEPARLAPANSVEFLLEPRDDPFSSYISGGKIVTAKRLKEIYIKTNSDIVFRYELKYEYSPDTYRSLLKSITQWTSDNKNFPTQDFTYQRAK